jgi:hypothetical protein
MKLPKKDQYISTKSNDHRRALLQKHIRRNEAGLAESCFFLSIRRQQNQAEILLLFELAGLIADSERLAKSHPALRLVNGVHEAGWGTKEFVIQDDQGHTLHFGETR